MNVFQFTIKTIVLLLVLAAPALALTEEQNSDGTARTILDYVEDYVDVPEGGTDWRIFGATKEINIETKTEDGYDLVYQKPEFQPEIKALDGKEIILKGFMFPLDEAENQKRFLFGPFPLSCPFHYHVGPALVVEVHAEKAPITFSYEPVTLKGKLELVPDDPETSVFYRLHNARDINHAAPGMWERLSSYFNLYSIRMKASAGDPAAQFKLGVLYYHGQGMAQDDAKAVYWFQKASDQGYTSAQAVLGALYYHGTGVAKDDESAYFWLTLADGSGGKKTSELRTSAADRLGPEKVLAIQKRVKSWHSSH